MMRTARLLGILSVTMVLLVGCSPADATSLQTVAADGSGSPSADSSQAAALDGVYRWTTTIAQTKGTAAEGAENDIPTDTTFIVAPNTFTVTLDNGRWTMAATATPRRDGGTYTADGRLLIMEWTVLPAGEGPWHMEYTYVVAADGSLQLEPKSTDAVTAFVFTANPWTRIG